MPKPSDLLAPRLVWVTTLALAGLVGWGFWGFSYDDNYVTYRYAQSWLEGRGLVYNPGEAVLGTSAPGYAVLLGSLGWLTRPLGIAIHHWGTLITLLSLFAVVGVLSAALRQVQDKRRWLIPLVFAALVFTARLDVLLLGAEAFPVVALGVVAGWVLLERGRPMLAGVLIAVAMALRLDAGLAALALGLVAWRHERRLPWLYAATGMGLLAVWLLFLWSLFGRVVPATLAGKTALQAVPYTLREWQTLAETLPLAGCLTLLIGALLGLVFAWREGWGRRPLVLALGSWVLMHEIAYRAIGVWFAPWYHVLLFQALLALCAVGMIEIARRGRAVALAGLLLVPLLGPAVMDMAREWRQPPDPRYRAYETAGYFLRDRVPAEAEVLALEIGVLGYVGQRRILDLGALVSPIFAEAKFKGTRAQLAAELEPDFIVAIDHPLMAEVLAQPAIQTGYRKIASWDDTLPGGGGVRILERVDGR